MNLLAIDFGTKNIGLAWCNQDLGVVLPYGRIDALKWKTDLLKLIKEEKIDKIIVGLPVGVGGDGQKNIERVKKFTEELRKEISISLEFVDERFSSQQADRMGGSSSRDEKSAMVILESYLGK